MRNAVTLVWGLLRLAPIMVGQSVALYHSMILTCGSLRSTHWTNVFPLRARQHIVVRKILCGLKFWPRQWKKMFYVTLLLCYSNQRQAFFGMESESVTSLYKDHIHSTSPHPTAFTASYSLERLAQIRLVPSRLQDRHHQIFYTTVCNSSIPINAAARRSLEWKVKR